MIKLFIASVFMVSSLFTHQVSAKTRPAQKEWTFLLFLNGHNNLDGFGAFNINQMEEIGSTDQLNMVVQWASLDNGDTRRLYIQKDSNTTNVNSPVVESLKAVDMGNYKNLVEFVKWGVEKYPAKHYMIAVWDHGSGWHKLARDNVSRDISYDDISGNKITTEELALAMDESAKIIGHKVDVYGSDACLMAMVEIGAQMQESVDYMVASEDLEPGEGWPYSTWMKRWAANPTATPEEVSKYLAQEYVKAYDGGIYSPSDVTFSALNLNHLPALVDAVKNLASSLVELSTQDLAATKSAAQGAMAFYYSDYKDLGSFIDKLSNAKTNVKESLLANVRDTMKDVVVENGATGLFDGAQGISLWLPLYDYDYAQYSERYSNLKFNKATDWSKYISLVAN